MSNASAPQDVVDAKASLDEHQNVSVSALAANTLVSNRSRLRRDLSSKSKGICHAKQSRFVTPAPFNSP